MVSEGERESDVENDRICPAWNLWVSFSLSQAALSPTLSPSLSFSLYVSLTHSHDFLSLSLVRFICANIYAELSCQLMSHSCPASALALVPCVCVCVCL